MNDVLSLPGLLRRHAGAVCMTLGLAAIATAAGIGLLGVSGWFLTGAALTTAGVTFNLFGPSSLVRGLSFVRILSRYGERLVGHDLTLGLLTDIRGWMFGRLLPRMPLRSDIWRHGDLVSALVTDIEALDVVFITMLGPILTVFAAGVAIAAILAGCLPGSLIVFLIGYGSAALIVPSVVVWRTRRSGEQVVVAHANLRALVLDAIEGHGDVLAFGQVARVQAEVEDATLHIAALDLHSKAMTAAGGAAVVGLAGLTALGVFWSGVGALQAGLIGGPTLVGLLLATLAVFEAASLAVRNAGRLGIALAAAKRLTHLANEPISMKEPVIARPLGPGASLAFRNVTFSHRAERPLLNDVSLVCDAGTRTAIIGESGCGKSTLINLALRIWEPSQGRVLIADTHITAVATRDVHTRIASISQDTPVFLGTIRENLLMGRPDADDPDLWRALDQARLGCFVAALPDRLETWCGEGGRTLSVGQSRRLCLARVLLTRASILLLDEPTSGLDREAETDFLVDLAAATNGRTVILATHALLPVGTMDRVYRLADGKLWAISS